MTPTPTPELQEFDAQGVRLEKQQTSPKDESRKGIMSYIMDIAKRIKVGTDITTISLTVPSLYELPESTLEIFQTSAMRHHDLLISANEEEDPVQRMILVVRYIFTLGAMMNGKKPLNPVLGETSHCKFYPDPNDDENYAACFGEQVSHHPPISSFHAENKKCGIKVSGSVKVSAKFMGTHVRLALDGKTYITLDKWNEVYTYSPPDASMHFFGLWAEYFGDVMISCSANNYKANFTFKAKSFWSEAHRIEGKITENNQVLVKFNGHWNDEVTFEDMRTGEVEIHDSALFEEGARVEYPKFEKESEWSSRRIWQHYKNASSSSEAAKAKRDVEVKQRQDRAERAEKGVTWTPKYFNEKTANDWRIKDGVKLWVD